MDGAVHAMSSAYDDLLAAAAGVLEAQQESGGVRTPATDAALHEFKQRMELLTASCDRAEDLVDSALRRLVAGADQPLAAAPEAALHEFEQREDLRKGEGSVCSGAGEKSGEVAEETGGSPEEEVGE